MVYNGHGEHGPEGSVVTFVRPFVAVVLVFDRVMAHDLSGSAAVHGDGLVEAEAHGVQKMRREPLGMVEKAVLWLECGVGRSSGSSDIKLAAAVRLLAAGSMEMDKAWMPVQWVVVAINVVGLALASVQVVDDSV